MFETPFIVAEISANHGGDFEKASKLVDYAAASGADAVKLQTYKPETMTLNIDKFRVSKGHELWPNLKLFDLYAKAMTPWEWHSSLFNRARELGITPFSSPFDRTAVDFLESLDCPIYKIASLETGDLDLIGYAASTKKPLIISTGATSLKEVESALEVAHTNGSPLVTLLVCTSSYPLNPKDAHISRIQTLVEEFHVPVGFSDHTLGIGASVAAVALGAQTIEKHLTISRLEGGFDSTFSLEPSEFLLLSKECRTAQQSLGSSNWENKDSETESRSLRRSLFIVRPVKRGEIATRENVKALRPNLGGPIKNLSQILGKKFVQDFDIGTPADLNCVGIN
jgi:N-acetylneuraminate synthase